MTCTTLRKRLLPWAVLFWCGCAGQEVPRDLHFMPTLSVEGDLEWTGTVLVDRIVVVRKGAHLTVAPGTKVLFRRIDWDGDGIGDAELNVEGRLTAVGTPDAPILFDSAEATPRTSDWKYLMVNFADAATLEFARVAHAHSGIQVHFSPARVFSCEFTRNVDGVRFSTARLKVEKCWIHGNVNGVRYEERGYPAEVVGNEISDNDTGIFAVTKCAGKTTFRGNNFRRNRYAVKLGWEQREDLLLGGNYWGERLDEVEAALLDRRTDPSLGKVVLTPALRDPTPVAIPPFSNPGDRDWTKI